MRRNHGGRRRGPRTRRVACPDVAAGDARRPPARLGHERPLARHGGRHHDPSPPGRPRAGDPPRGDGGRHRRHHGARRRAALRELRAGTEQLVLRRGRAQHGPVVAQLLLRRVRARRPGVDRQDAGRPLAAGRQHEAVRIQLGRGAIARGGRRRPGRAARLRPRAATLRAAGRARRRGCARRAADLGPHGAQRHDGLADDAAGRAGGVARGRRRAAAQRVVRRRGRRGPGHGVQRQGLRGADRAAGAGRSRLARVRSSGAPARARGRCRPWRVRRRQPVLGDRRLAGRRCPAVADRLDERQRLERRLRVQRDRPPARARVGGRAGARSARSTALPLHGRSRLRRSRRSHPAGRGGLRHGGPRRLGADGAAARAQAPSGRGRRIPRRVARDRRGAVESRATHAAAVSGSVSRSAGASQRSSSPAPSRRAPSPTSVS